MHFGRPGLERAWSASMSPQQLTNTLAKLARADEHLHSLDCEAEGLR